jgi:hypothetical protein
MVVDMRFAINLARAIYSRYSIKLERKCAGWHPNYLADIPDLLPP